MTLTCDLDFQSLASYSRGPYICKKMKSQRLVVSKEREKKRIDGRTRSIKFDYHYE